MSIHTPFAVTANLVRLAAHAVANDAGKATFAVEADAGRATTAFAVTASNSIGATHTAAVTRFLATAHAIRARSVAALPLAVILARRATETTTAVYGASGTAHAVVADLIRVAARIAAMRFAAAAFSRTLSSQAKSRGPQTKRRQHRAANCATDHAEQFATRN